MNAYKHGGRSRATPKILPHENPECVKLRVEQYLEDLQPGDSMEIDLVHQMARLSLTIERAERMELAHMEERIRKAAQERVQGIHPRRLEEIQELGRRLLYVAAADEIKIADKPLWSDDPRLLVAKLEATADGCRWLLDRWAEFRGLLDTRSHWELPVLLRFIRLQGKLADEAVFDPALNSIFLAWDVIIPKFARHSWEKFRDTRSQAETACLYGLRWREISPRPSDENEAWMVLHAIVGHQTERLNALLERNDAMEKEESDGWIDRAALDLSPEFERHRRSLSAKTRELLKTIEAFCKVRKNAVDSGSGAGRSVVGDGQTQIAADPRDSGLQRVQSSRELSRAVAHQNADEPPAADQDADDAPAEDFAPGGSDNPPVADQMPESPPAADRTAEQECETAEQECQTAEEAGVSSKSAENSTNRAKISSAQPTESKEVASENAKQVAREQSHSPATRQEETGAADATTVTGTEQTDREAGRQAEPRPGANGPMSPGGAKRRPPNSSAWAIFALSGRR